MKGSIIVLLFFVAGCILGVMGWLPFDLKQSNLTMYILYALMLQVGLSIGSSKDLKYIISDLRLKYLLIPLATICGTLLFSALASLLISRWSIFDCMAVGSGFALVHPDYSVQRSFYRTSTCYRIRNNRIAV